MRERNKDIKNKRESIMNTLKSFYDKEKLFKVI
jgi:hypothetical protein